MPDSHQDVLEHMYKRVDDQLIEDCADPMELVEAHIREALRRYRDWIMPLGFSDFTHDKDPQGMEKLNAELRLWNHRDNVLSLARMYELLEVLE